MTRQDWNQTLKVLAGAALLAALGAGFLIAQGMDDDDRPPIIVHNGSLIFDGGEGTNFKTWSKDALLGEWKPRQDEADGVRTFEVTFVAVPPPAPACGGSTMTGKEVRIEYRVDPAGNPSAVMRLHLRKKHLLFKREPKLDTDGKKMTLLEHTSLTPTPPMLVYEDGAQGWISKVTVEGTACEFAKPPDETTRKAFRVRIQPKRDD